MLFLCRNAGTAVMRNHSFSTFISNFDKTLYRLCHWETWYWLVKYFPIMPFWAWYCLRARSLWFFTPSNPTLTFGGFEGENKREMYAQLPPATYPKTCFVDYPTPFSKVENLVETHQLTFPVAVKPDVGRMGLMFRKLESLAELRQYHEKMKVDYLIQEFIPYPLEVSVFYYRIPGQQRGTITGFVKKEYLSVTGDGKSTLSELIASYPRVRYRQEEMTLKHAANLDDIIPLGEEYILSHALNLSRGGKLVSLAHEKDDRLLKVFDGLSHYSGNFYFGRYDIKCASVDDLKQGRNFYILEFNGSGAEPHHVYGNGNTLIQALTILVQHWDILFRISSLNRKNGIRCWSFRQGYEHLQKAKEHFTFLKELEAESSLATSATHRAEARDKTRARVNQHELKNFETVSDFRVPSHE
jgi:hypothetical protein